MANIIDGTFSLRQMVFLTRQNKPNRFEYQVRDVLKTILIKRKTELSPDRPLEPTHTLSIESYSYPQYPPYYKEKTARYGKQRKVKHQYDIVLSLRMNEKGKGSVDTTLWKMRLGSGKKWVDKPPQSKIKSIYRETAKKWKEELEKDLTRIKTKITNKDDRKKALNERRKEHRERIAKHRKDAKYLDVGDYNSRVLGINGDAYFRVHSVLSYYGHLYGKSVDEGTGDIGKPFLPKHVLNLLNQLMKIGILSQ